jgi:CRISPR-associated protein Cas2
MDADRTQLMLTHLRKYLTHVQNSVCESDISQSDFDEMKSEAEEIANDEESIMFYAITNDAWLDRYVIGDDPTEESNFI